MELRAAATFGAWLACAAALPAAAAEVNVVVDTALDVRRISPYVYGSNGHGGDAEANVAAIRQGGNRTTGYNWETNYSSAGSDWQHSSDDYVVRDLPRQRRRVPGIVVGLFHERAVELRAADLITLQMAGYVAADNRGTVTEAETAPSPRWKRIEFRKPGHFSLQPDTDDGVVYMDELVNLLVQRYGRAAEGGVQMYSLDNEPALWRSTHPRIHPEKLRCDELTRRSVALARAVKDVDPTAMVSGPALYDWAAFESLQGAPDWEIYSEDYDGWFINFYLDRMGEAEERYGIRLLDILDVHWYPEVRVEDVRINHDGGLGNEAMMRARMHAPRSLWDADYREDSWLGNWRHPVRLLGRLKDSVEEHYPGTLLAITEFDYGGAGDASGAVAQADFLGICGREGVYMTNHWGALRGHVLAGYQIFRNYDGQNATFGGTSVRAATSDAAETSAYASLDEEGALHLVLINKRFEPTAFNVECRHDTALTDAEAWLVDATGPAVRRLEPGPSPRENRVIYTAPPTSVTHVVLRDAD
jgi:mannan endo-1,4-beta-mannosidase